MLIEKICCNCRYYEGVHGCTGCAPCEKNKIMVLWNNLCEYIWLIPTRLQVEKRMAKYIDFSEVKE